MPQKITSRIRILDTMDEFLAVSRLECIIWDVEDIEATAPSLMRVLSHSGGLVLGAEHEGEMIGFSYGVPARRHGEWVLWSHQTGVLKEYQRNNIGYQLKQFQREWAGAKGYEVVAWTFDPMRRGNANLNLRRLGGVGKAYSPDHYGIMTDAINAGMASDRLETWWSVDDPAVVARYEGSFQPTQPAADDLVFLLSVNGDAFSLNIPQAFTASHYAIEIPLDLNALKATRIDYAQTWQGHLRTAMQAAFAAGYVPVDFVTEAERCYYIWTKHE